MKLRILSSCLLLLFATGCPDEAPCVCAYTTDAYAGDASEKSWPESLTVAPEGSGFHKVTLKPEHEEGFSLGDRSWLILQTALNDSSRPPFWLVSPSELINGWEFESNDQSDDQLEIQVEVHPAPWKTDHRLVRIHVQGFDETLTPSKIELFFNEFAVLSYRVLGSAGMDRQNSGDGLNMTSANTSHELPNITALVPPEDPTHQNFTSTFFVEVVLRPEVEPPIRDLLLFDLKLISEEDTLESIEVLDQGEGELTASRDFQFSSAIAWWSLLLTEQMYAWSIEWDLIPYTENSLDPENHPEREDIIPLMQKFNDLISNDYGWDCVMDYPYYYDCDC